MKKAFIRGLAGAATAVALVTASFAFADDTIKIGVLLIDTGPLAGLKETQTKAVNLAIEQINAAGGAAGKKLDPVFITYAGTPDAAVDGATRAVQKDGAIFLTGMDTSAVSPALSAEARLAQCPDGRSVRAGRRADRQGLQPQLLPRQYERLHAHERDRRTSEGQRRQDMEHHRR